MNIDSVDISDCELPSGAPTLPLDLKPDGASGDWNYADRREMQEIVRDLYLGPYSVAVRSKVGQL